MPHRPSPCVLTPHGPPTAVPKAVSSRQTPHCDLQAWRAASGSCVELTRAAVPPPRAATRIERRHHAAAALVKPSDGCE
eukprot:2568461-Prymnesium_polylepis.1